MAARCTTKKRALAAARARARATGDKASIWKCGPCFRVTTAAKPPARCTWQSWVLPPLRR